MELRFERFLLRPWRSGDEESLVRHADNRKVWRNLRDQFPHPYTRAHAEAWLRQVSTETRTLNFAMVVEGSAAGGIGLRLGRDVHRRSAEIGFWLGEAYWGRGIITEAVRAVTDHGFQSLDLCRIQAAVFEWNPASMRVLEKAGYTCEGRLKRSVIKDGQTIDAFLYAVTRDCY